MDHSNSPRPATSDDLRQLAVQVADSCLALQTAQSAELQALHHSLSTDLRRQLLHRAEQADLERSFACSTQDGRSGISVEDWQALAAALETRLTAVVMIGNLVCLAAAAVAFTLLR